MVDNLLAAAELYVFLFFFAAAAHTGPSSLWFDEEKSLFVGWVGILDGIRRGSQWTESPQPYGADESPTTLPRPPPKDQVLAFPPGHPKFFHSVGGFF